ncbi:MAG: hypothetical protein EP344_00225 [Bacteroidetes bacterium]|nr:MAG: hypothetical protein EP344_00225 [Bacteroidota bacterium]
MKTLKFFLTIALFCFAFFSISCTKESLNDSTPAPTKRVNRENVDTGITKVPVVTDDGPTTRKLPNPGDIGTKLSDDTEVTRDDYPKARVPHRPVNGGREAFDDSAIRDDYKVKALHEEKQ